MFLGKLASELTEQFQLGENTDHTLDVISDDGSVQKFGKLGNLQFDQSAERKYVEEGYLRLDSFNTDPKRFADLIQEPNATILVKKRMFSSIGENFRPDYMDVNEKLYYKTIKILFQNKCKQISALEKLSKIQKVTSGVGDINEQLLPVIFSLTDQLNDGNGITSLFGDSNPFKQNTEFSNFTKVVDRLRKYYAFSQSNAVTTWITDDTNLFQSQFGQGTGVIEITNFSNLSTNSTNSISSPGSFSFNIYDPYKSMLITEFDIEKALADATNSIYNHKIFQFGKDNVDQTIADLQNRFNQLRSSRGASPITLKINPDTLLGKRVVAIVDRIGEELIFSYDSTGGTGFPGLGGFGNSVNVSNDYLINGILGFDGLNTKKIDLAKTVLIKSRSDSELTLFQSLIAAIFNKIQLEANSQNNLFNTNQNTNYARRKLRFNFAGKLIIQPMDVVHIYLNSKSRYDTKLLSGVENMFSGNGILQNLNKTIVDFKNAADSLFNPGGNINFQVEKAAFVGPEFPNFLWSMIRDQFVSEKEGTHVFAGIVEDPSERYSNGEYEVSVSGRDNSAYFELGKINFKPGVDVFNGAIFDPLTPFKSNFDSVVSNAKNDLPELLDENKAILNSSDVPLVKFKLGPNAGQRVTENNYIQDRVVDKGTGLITKVFYAPDGLVYKWKEGIGVVVQFGSSLDLNDPHKIGIPNIAVQPFAGQDVMNVLSLLITGVPYNFATYWKTTQNFDGFGRDPQSRQDAAHSFSTSLQNNLIKNNTLWGNFIPFKNLILDEQSYSMALKSQTNIINNNNLINQKLKELDALSTNAALLGISNIANPDVGSSARAALVSKAFETLNSDVLKLISQVKDENRSYFSMVGDDVSFDLTSFIDSSKISKQASDPSIRKNIRRQINYLTRRLSYNVRGNEDKNLFIVDDFYDKDYDIAAYESALTNGISLYSNDNTSVKEKIISAAHLLNLEVFCDTQGHIRVRPPQYNRMPSSVFRRMLFLKKSLGIQVFPQFLDDLFSTQLKTLRERLEIVEDQIRLDCAVINLNDDSSALSFLSQGDLGDASGSPFAFLSNSDGIIVDIQNILEQANADLQGDQKGQDFVTIKNQATSTKDVFSPSQRFTAIINVFNPSNNQSLFGTDVSIETFDNNTRINNLIDRIETKSGQKISRNFFVKTPSNVGSQVVIPANTTVDIFKVTQDLSDKILERQKVIKLFYNAIKNSTEFKSLDVDDSNTGTGLLFPDLTDNSNIPEVFEHMIEDESYDDYGVGSGSRYIIKDVQIISSNFQETAPDYTMVEVQGNLNPFSSSGFNPVPGLDGSFPEGGNGLVTATAVDYDMWRNYGLRNVCSVKVPFLSDANSQCAPYASMLLSIARKNVLKGNVTIAGNEFMQQGEVVFIEGRGMLYYVTSVKHNFTFGTTFTTDLELSYGHTPGEYIPTTLDIIGKMIYNNRDIAALEIQRQSNSSNEINMGIIQKNTSSSNNNLTNVESDQSANSFNTVNSQTINNILYEVAYLINGNNSSGNNVIANLELRIYHDDNNGVDTDLSNFAAEARNIFINGTIGPKDDINSSRGIGNASILSDNIKIIEVNMSSETDNRSPSQKAIDAARNIVSNSSTGVNSDKDKIRTALYKNVIDCWVQFSSPNSQPNPVGA